MKKVHLVYVVNKGSYFITHRLSLAKAALNEGYRVSLVCPLISDEEKKIISEYNISYYPVKMSRSGMNVFNEFYSIYNLYKVLKKINPEIIHLLTIKPVIYGALVSRLLRNKKTICAVTGLGYVFTEGNWLHSLRKKTFILIYKIALNLKKITVIFQNQDDQKYFIRKKICAKNNSVLIESSGVDLTVFKPVQRKLNEKIKIGFASRLIWDKGVKEYIESAKIIKNKNISDLEFLIAGEPDLGNPRSVPIDDIKSWHRDKTIKWLGRVENSNMPNFFSEIEIFCLPTFYKEGIPKVLLEAAASGCILISTDIPGCRDVIENFKNGVLVKPRDIKGLSDAIKWLVSLSAEERIKMKQYSIDLVRKKFDVVYVNRKTITLYKIANEKE